jgi:hypothetical protein
VNIDIDDGGLETMKSNGTVGYVGGLTKESSLNHTSYIKPTWFAVERDADTI